MGFFEWVGLSLFLIYLFTYFWSCLVFVATRGLSLVVASGLLIVVASFVEKYGLQGTQA